MNFDCCWLYTRMAHAVLLTTSVTDAFSILLFPVQKLFMYIKSAYKKKEKKGNVRKIAGIKLNA